MWVKNLWSWLKKNLIKYSNKQKIFPYIYVKTENTKVINFVFFLLFFFFIFLNLNLVLFSGLFFFFWWNIS